MLVIGAETYSRILDWNDRGTCVLFGDGAGAVVLRAERAPATGAIAASCPPHLHCRRPPTATSCYVDGGPSARPAPSGMLRMNGREVFRHAVTKLAAVVDEALAANGLTHGDIDWLVPHQANLRIIDAHRPASCSLPPEQVVITVDRHANTSAASIPLALAEARADGRIQPGDLVLIEAIGGGLTWGAALVRW